MTRNSYRRQLISYIAPSAPATRRPAEGNESFLRPEIGFTPAWYHSSPGIEFGERWHTDPACRRETIIAMRDELRRRFPGTAIGGIGRHGSPLDLLTGTYGACTIAAIYGIPIVYAENKWPDCEKLYLTDDDTDSIQSPDLDTNPFFQNLMSQVDWIAGREGRVEGFINWQGILNNAHRLRGAQLFCDMIEQPERCRRLFDCVCSTMIDSCKRLHDRQRQSGVEIDFFTVSNCLVNMVSPAHYRDLLFPYDRRIAEAFACIGVHNCAWNADPYIDDYAKIPNLAYIDMGMESNLRHARKIIPLARRAIMYTPMDLKNKPISEIQSDLEKIARDYGPCDIVFADIEYNTPDDRVLNVIDLCTRISKEHTS